MSYPVRNEGLVPQTSPKELVYRFAREVGLDVSLLEDLTDDPIYNEAQKAGFFYYKGGSADGRVHLLREALRNELGLGDAVKISVVSF